MYKIVLIDDKTDIPNNLKKSIERIFPSFEGIIEVWNKDNMDYMNTLYNDNKSDPDKESNADEDIWKRVIETQKIDMIVIDHDLSAIDAVRISESSIANACKQASIPVCTYHRKPLQNSDSQALKSRVNQARSFSIEIDMDEVNDYQNASREIINIFNGFKNIETNIFSLNPEILNGGPAKILSHILGKIELESLFSRYTSSSTLASDIIKEDSEEDNTEYLKKRLPFILGCWLYNYILPFPGIILNNIAAASYINLDLDQFKNLYNDEFDSAKYIGPFSENASYWWRYDLDQIFFDENCEDAIEYLSKKDKHDVLGCNCSVSEQPPAGYYCIVKQLPISLENSEGPLSWIPEGADLCRINKKIYSRLAPIMGL